MKSKRVWIFGLAATGLLVTAGAVVAEAQQRAGLRSVRGGDEPVVAARPTPTAAAAPERPGRGPGFGFGPGPGPWRGRGPQGGPPRGPRDGMMPPPFGHGLRMLGCLRDLELPQEQRDAVRALMVAHHQAMDAHRAAVRDALEAHAEILLSADPDPAALAAAEEKIKELAAAGLEAKLRLTRDVRALLSDEQAAALAACALETTEEHE